MRNRRLSVALLGTTTALSVVLWAGTASAQPVELSDQQVVASVDQAADAAGQQRGIGLETSGASVTKTGAASVSVSSETGATVTLTADGTSGTRVVDDTAVADVAGATIVSEAMAQDSARQAISIPDASAPTSYTFTLDVPEGLSTRVAADGDVEIFGVAEGVDIVFGSIAAPWAKDANGANVPTSFQVNGNTLTQTVEHNGGTAYPVTADPKLTFGTSVYLNLWGSEANAIAYAFNAVAIGGVFVGCSSVFRTALKAFGPAGRIADGVVGLLCTFGGATAVALLWDALNTTNFNPNACYQKDIFDSSTGFYFVPNTNCE
ncbi:hypothetical protein ABH939_005893 [Rhodococcus sp. 27YEA6]